MFAVEMQDESDAMKTCDDPTWLNIFFFVRKVIRKTISLQVFIRTCTVQVCGSQGFCFGMRPLSSSGGYFHSQTHTVSIILNSLWHSVNSGLVYCSHTHNVTVASFFRFLKPVGTRFAPCGIFWYNLQSCSDLTAGSCCRLQIPGVLLVEPLARRVTVTGKPRHSGCGPFRWPPSVHARCGSEAEKECAALDNATSCHHKWLIHLEVNEFMGSNWSQGSHFFFYCALSAKLKCVRVSTEAPLTHVLVGDIVVEQCGHV